MFALLLSLTLSEPRPLRVAVAPAESLTVVVDGAGSPVVLVPGLFGSAYGFRRLVPLLAAAGHLTIVIEPLAVGTSGRPERADYSLAAQAARIASVCDSLGVSGAVIVGHSMGAAIAYRVALARPDLVRAIVSLEGGPAESAASPGFRRALSLAPMVRLAGGGFLRGRIRSGLKAASGDTTWITDQTLAHYTEGATRDLSATLRAYLRMAESREPTLLAPRLAAMPCPVLLLLGGAPHQSAPRAAEVAQLAAVPGFMADTVAGAGHYLHEERPDAVAAAVSRVSAVAVVAHRP